MIKTTNEAYLRECLSQAKYFEFCKEFDRALKVLSLVCGNLDEIPDVEGLSDDLACDLLIVWGSALSFHGMQHQKKNSQELANDILTRAREIAIKLGEREWIAESEKATAVAYWRVGEYDNAIAYSNTVLSHYSFEEHQTEKVCLLTRTNLIMLCAKTEEFEEGKKLINEIEPFIERHEDAWLKASFYNQSGAFYLHFNNYERAMPFLEKTVEAAISTRNNHYLGSALNNLAFVHLKLLNIELAFNYVNEALALYARLNLPFSRAQVLETKAQIHLVQGKLKEALVTIDESINILRQGENYPQLCESMWTRFLVFVQSEEKNRATQQFTELMRVVSDRLSQAVADKYTAQFNEIFYMTTGSNFYEQTDNFRRHLLSNALRSAGGKVKQAAAHLGISHQNTSALVKKFPDLCEAYGIKTRTRRVSILAPKKSKDVKGIILTCDRLAYLNLPKGTLVRVHIMEISELDLSKPVAVKDDSGGYHCGFFDYFMDDGFEMFGFSNGNGDTEKTYIPSEILSCGQVISFYDESSGEFKPIQ